MRKRRLPGVRDSSNFFLEMHARASSSWQVGNSPASLENWPCDGPITVGMPN